MNLRSRQRCPTRPARRVSARVALTVGVALATLAGCGPAKADRAKAEALRKTQLAIHSYSEASKKANGLHGEVIKQFGKANASTNLQDYREAMRKDVLPAMDRFVATLRGMPTSTPELERIHAGLVSAYSEARTDIAAYVDRLQTARDLERFVDIRKRLQRRVAAYQRDLATYYKQWNRQLRLADRAAGGTAPPEASTPTAAP